MGKKCSDPLIPRYLYAKGLPKCSAQDEGLSGVQGGEVHTPSNGYGATSD